MFKRHDWSNDFYFGTTRHQHLRDAIREYTDHGWHITHSLRECRQLELIVTRNDRPDISRNVVIRVVA